MEQQQLETALEVVDALSEPRERLDHPVYARTQHGTYYFVIEDVETVRVEGEVRSVIVLREVEWAGEKPDKPNPAAVVTLPFTCDTHGVALRYTKAEASIQNRKLMLLVDAEPHRGEEGFCSRSYGVAVELDR